MGNTLNSKKANGLALIPFLIFIVVYMGAGLIYQAQGVETVSYTHLTLPTRMAV